jgi:hypothetical protein
MGYDGRSTESRGGEMIDNEVLYTRYLDEEEMALFKEITSHDVMNLTESLYWLLLREIARNRAVADSLHRRLAALRASELKEAKEGAHDSQV